MQASDIEQSKSPGVVPSWFSIGGKSLRFYIATTKPKRSPREVLINLVSIVSTTKTATSKGWHFQDLLLCAGSGLLYAPLAQLRNVEHGSRDKYDRLDQHHVI